MITKNLIMNICKDGGGKMNGGIIIVESRDLIKNLLETNDKELNERGMLMALDHIYRGAMDGAQNKEYIKATKECYQIISNFIKIQFEGEK